MAPEGSKELLGILEGRDPEILLPLLSEYASRWRHNSNQIWSTGAVFIPLSLSGVALGFTDPYRTLAVAGFSIILIWIWYALSARLRSAIDYNWRVYAAIESSLLKLDPPRLEHGLDEVIWFKGKRYLPLRRVRFSIPLIITVAWISIIALVFTI